MLQEDNPGLGWDFVSGASLLYLEVNNIFAEYYQHDVFAKIMIRKLVPNTVYQTLLQPLL